MPETFTPLQTLSAAAFVDGIGADTHIAYTDGEYSSISLVLSDLEYLGIDQIRDGISDRENGSAPITSYISLAQAGIQFTFIIQASDDAELQSQLQLVNEVEAAAPGSIIAIEGPNEINNAPVTFDGTAGLAGALDLQAALVADLHADRLLAGVAVDYFTGYDTGTIGLGPDPVADGLANYDNQHPYPTDGEPPASSVSRAQALPNTTFANEPAVYTETGYSTDKVNQDVQAVYELDLLMDTARDGISKTYLYDLLDAYAPGSPQGDDGFGLFGYTKAPKEVAVDLHNLTGILREAGTGTAISQTGSISFAISGLPSTGNALVLNEPNGNVLLAVWAEPKIWDNASGSELAAPAETVTITPDGAYSAALVFARRLARPPLPP